MKSLKACAVLGVVLAGLSSPPAWADRHDSMQIVAVPPPAISYVRIDRSNCSQMNPCAVVEPVDEARKKSSPTMEARSQGRPDRADS
jgi:hypothetical protein